MTNDEQQTTNIDDIRARLAAATPGPWASTWDEQDPRDDGAIIYSTDAGVSADERCVVGSMYYDGRWAACTRENAAFIAHAPADIALLLAERDAAAQFIATLRAERAALEDERDELKRQYAVLRTMCDGFVQLSEGALDNAEILQRRLGEIDAELPSVRAAISELGANAVTTAAQLTQCRAERDTAITLLAQIRKWCVYHHDWHVIKAIDDSGLLEATK